MTLPSSRENPAVGGVTRPASTQYTRSLDALPADVIAHLTLFLSQLDALNLAKTSRTMLHSCLPRLYASVVVEAHYTQFSKEYAAHETYVNSLYNFKKLLRSPRRHTIRLLRVSRLPDLTTIYDATMRDLVGSFFAGLHGLYDLAWLAGNFHIEYLARLPNRAQLERLELHFNFANFEWANKQLLRFPSLRVLLIRPFLSLARLADLLSRLLCPSELENSPLTSLSLARADTDAPALLLPAHELSNLQDATSNADIDVHTVEALLGRGPLARLGNLSVLCLNTLLVNALDANRLVASGALGSLTKLQLKNVAEYGTSGAEDLERGVSGLGNGHDGFLAIIAPRLIALRLLHLDFRETRGDTIASFLERIPKLTALDLVVRMNAVKKRHVNELQLYARYASAIARHSELTRLAVEIRQEYSYCERSTPSPVVIVDVAANLRLLRSLRLPFVDGHDTDLLLSALRSLKNLLFFDTSGINTGGAPNLGLGMVHPNVYDEWFRVQHFAVDFYKLRETLRYVRINECVFECEKGRVNPRDVIDRWFDEKVRV